MKKFLHWLSETLQKGAKASNPAVIPPSRYKPTQVYSFNERVYGDPNKVQLIRRLSEVPDVDADGNAILVPENNLFANFTTDLPFRRHTRYTTQHPYAIHFDATKVGDARPISTQPSDTFFLNGDIKVRPSDVTFVSGDLAALKLAESRGFRVQPLVELQPNIGGATKSSQSDAVDFTKIFDNYFESMRPTMGDYKALELKWGTKIPVEQLTDANSTSFDFLLGVKDPLNFKNVIYHPAHPAESNFVYSDGIKELFKNYHLSLGAHASYDLPIDRVTAKGLVKAYLKDNPYENKEYFSSLTADHWDDLFLRLRNLWESAEPEFKQVYTNKLQILRDNHAKAVAKRSGRILSKDSNGDFVFTDPITGEYVTKSSAPITSTDDTRPFWTSIRLGIRDNLSNPDPKYVLFPAAAAAASAASDSNQQNPYKNETGK